MAANVLTHGTGALNIDACRIGTGGGCRKMSRYAGQEAVTVYGNGLYQSKPSAEVDGLGRWPANVILDEHAAEIVDEQSGVQKSGTAVQRNGGGRAIFGAANDGKVSPDVGYGDSGGASPIFLHG